LDVAPLTDDRTLNTAELASPIFASWNQMVGWLQAVEGFGAPLDQPSGVLVWNSGSGQVAAVVHPVVQDANDQHACVVRLEDALATAGGI